MSILFDDFDLDIQKTVNEYVGIIALSMPSGCTTCPSRHACPTFTDRTVCGGCSVATCAGGASEGNIVDPAICFRGTPYPV